MFLRRRAYPRTQDHAKQFSPFVVPTTSLPRPTRSIISASPIVLCAILIYSVPSPLSPYVLPNVASGVYPRPAPFLHPSFSFAGPSNSTRTEQLSVKCLSSLHPSSSTASTGGAHAPKRRQAKRTEEEPIEYLRADLYVGKLDAFGVLCASCDKWIRLRPNTTPKISTPSERNSIFTKDPDVRKFDPERLLCNLCDRWLSLPPDDHLGAVQRLISHRTSERRNAKAAEIASTKATSSSQQHPSNSNPHRRFVHHSDHSTHPSHLSSHSSLGRGYPSTYPHRQQQQRAHQGLVLSPHRAAHHGDEDAPMSDGELDYPNASASG
ncbi:hypothetical protein BDN70DRAFT_937402 [Pholiota conissans]|uniref:Uncharacterized protein n=1 Tax=Pholiota conissans TaxID=109636 RepID=A0A9P5YQY6_9AGAR|nr:hypothetical protein BDN70DRAFT_937402 [Pholiota conissans]